MKIDVSQLPDSTIGILTLSGVTVSRRSMRYWKKEADSEGLVDLANAFCTRGLITCCKLLIQQQGRKFFLKAQELEFSLKDEGGEIVETADTIKVTGEDLLGLLDVVPSDDESRKILDGRSTRRSRNPQDIRTVAFYLPQFYPFPENDRWWGKGFTEWSNVVDAKPQFPGHNMPLVPADLGFYDLRVEDVRARQADLAREYGIDAFCYYYYWFSGRRLMQHVLDEILASGHPSTDFCLCWANESWSRRWDGSEGQVDLLIKQEHDPAKDIEIFNDLLPFFRDERYITIDDQPVFLIYRLDIMNKPDEVIASWKRAAVNAGFKGLFVVACRTFGLSDAAAECVDAVVDFPPHTSMSREISEEVASSSEFEGKIYDFRQVVVEAATKPIGRKFAFPGVMPRWDNTARKGRKSHIFFNSSPEAFKIWLSIAMEQVAQYPAGKRMIFINSWNEWGEGAMLEPDRIYGRSFLEAVRSVKGGYIFGPADTAKFSLVSSISRERATGLLESFSSEVHLVAQILGRVRRSSPRKLRKDEPEIIRLSSTSVKSDGGILVIDRSSPQAIEDCVPISDAAIWSFSGWAFVKPSVPHLHNRVAYLVVTNVDDTTNVYHLPINSWRVRSDVAKHHSFQLADSECYFGFDLIVSLAPLLPGDYRIQLIQNLDGELFSASSFTVIRRV